MYNINVSLIISNAYVYLTPQKKEGGKTLKKPKQDEQKKKDEKKVTN